jgi:hypothetical protein
MPTDEEKSKAIRVLAFARLLCIHQGQWKPPWHVYGLYPFFQMYSRLLISLVLQK